MNRSIDPARVMLALTGSGVLAWLLDAAAEPLSPSSSGALVESGLWAVRFLLFSLAMSPLNSYLGWRRAISLRKPAGLWAFVFASLHVAIQLEASGASLTDRLWVPFLFLGFVGIGILVALAATSSRGAMRRLGKNWKRLHRTVYAAGLAVCGHALLAASQSKLMMFQEPHIERQLGVQLGVMFGLLVVRLPAVRRSVLAVASLARRRAVTADRRRIAITPIRVPETPGRPWKASQLGLAETSLPAELRLVDAGAEPARLRHRNRSGDRQVVKQPVPPTEAG
ncbi:MAG TPA: ferric reductase-like transmembrane domain-containing protein [Anaerolineales bacterium]|jgi:sulfoxide reductase heme-binding subunit YedZ